MSKNGKWAASGWAGLDRPDPRSLARRKFKQASLDNFSSVCLYSSFRCGRTAARPVTEVIDALLQTTAFPTTMNDLVFRTGWVKRTLGWVVFLGSAGLLLALVYAVITHWDTQTSADLWSGAAIGLFIIVFMVAGIAIQYTYWSTQNDVITSHSLFRTQSFPISDLAGFSRITIIVSIFPLLHVDLFDRELKKVARLPVQIKDWPRAEERLASRLRYVVNDGSAALPKHRFADAPKP